MFLNEVPAAAHPGTLGSVNKRFAFLNKSGSQRERKLQLIKSRQRHFRGWRLAAPSSLPPRRSPPSPGAPEGIPSADIKGLTKGASVSCQALTTCWLTKGRNAAETEFFVSSGNKISNSQKFPLSHGASHACISNTDTFFIKTSFADAAPFINLVI